MSGHPALLQFLSALLQTGKSIISCTPGSDPTCNQSRERRGYGGSGGSEGYSERVVFSFHLPESPCRSAHERRRVLADRQDVTAVALHLVLSVRLSGPGRARRGAGCCRCNSSLSKSSRGDCYQQAGARQNTFATCQRPGYLRGSLNHVAPSWGNSGGAWPR